MKKKFPLLPKLTRLPLFFLSAVLVAGVAIAIYGFFFSNPALASWMDENWLFRQAIPISAHTAAENNVYITATIDTATPITAGKMQSDCGDLRFTKENGENLPYFINASPGCNNAATTVQVEFNSFPAGAQTIYYYYGNASAPNGFNSAAFTTAASGATIGSVGSETQGPGPVGYWKFDDGQGQTVQDSSSSKNNGTLGATTGSSTDDPTWTTEDQCVSGKCLKFDGSNDATTIPSSTKYDFGAGNYTISSWIRGTGTDDYRAIVFRYSMQSVGFAFLTDITTGTIRTWASGSVLNGTSNVLDNKWHYVTVTRNGATLTIYVDGKAENSRSDVASENVTLSSSAVTIGYNAAASAYPWKGSIDDVKIYPYARSAAQIKTDYNSRGAAAKSGSGASLGSKPQDWLSNGLVGYWKMDENSGNATDSSGNGYTLTNTNTATFAAGQFGNATSLAAASSQYFVKTSATPFVTSGPYTVSYWAYVTSYPTRYSGVMAYTNTDGGVGNWIVGVDSTGKLQFFNLRAQGVNGIYYYASTSSVIPLNAWTLITAVYDGTNTLAYVNGSAVTLAAPIADGTGFPTGLNVGRSDPADTDYFFTGRMDEIRYYNRALSPKEVSDLYNWAPGPKTYLKMEEGAGTSANDSSGNSNNGTVNSGTWTTGKYGKGVNVNGSSGSNVSIPDFAY